MGIASCEPLAQCGGYVRERAHDGSYNADVARCAGVVGGVRARGGVCEVLGACARVGKGEEGAWGGWMGAKVDARARARGGAKAFESLRMRVRRGRRVAVAVRCGVVVLWWRCGVRAREGVGGWWWARRTRARLNLKNRAGD